MSATNSLVERYADVLLTAPRAVDHVPPKDTDTDDVLVEEVHNPAYESVTRPSTLATSSPRLTYYHSSGTTSDRARATTASGTGTEPSH